MSSRVEILLIQSAQIAPGFRAELTLAQYKVFSEFGSLPRALKHKELPAKAASEPKPELGPLRIGDRVRLINDSITHGAVLGEVGTVWARHINLPDWHRFKFPGAILSLPDDQVEKMPSEGADLEALFDELRQLYPHKGPHAVVVNTADYEAFVRRLHDHAKVVVPSADLSQWRPTHHRGVRLVVSVFASRGEITPLSRKEYEDYFSAPWESRW